LAYHYINRMVNVFAVETPFGGGPQRFRALVKRLAASMFRRSASRRLTPGDSLDLLAAAPLHHDFAWAKSDPVIAQAFARAAAAFDAAGEQAVPQQTRRMLEARLREWNGEDPGISRAWTYEHTMHLPASQRPLARFVLLVALASYQVDADVIRQARPNPSPEGDETLIAAAAWASFAAVRRISTWL
jgi:hypothetical protein